MHFSIPDTQELYAETTGNTYTAFNIFINGSYHASLRYNKLNKLNEQLRKLCLPHGITLPEFPPKKLLPLTNSQVECRRQALEHYLQIIGQDARITKMSAFQNFLIAAQLETALAEGVFEDYFGYGSSDDGEGAGTGEEFRRVVCLEVTLPNGYQLQVNCRVNDNASGLLEKAMSRLSLPTEMLSYFCLFLVRREARDSLVLLRKLMDFETPFISRLYNQPCQIQVRKSYWNPNYDKILMKNPIALNMLFIQTVMEVEREWIIAPPEIQNKMKTLQEYGMKKEYIQLAEKLPSYGCVQFLTSTVDYPEKDTKALITIGNKELSMRTVTQDKILETKFRVTRMRVWRVTAIHNTQTQDSSSATKDKQTNLQLSFEYLMSKQNLKWITIHSPQAMLMSVCLQEMVNELLNYSDSELILKSNTPSSQCSASSTTSSSSSSCSSASYAANTFSASTSSTPTSNYYSADPLTAASTPNTPHTATILTDSPCDAPVKFLAQRILSNKQNPKISNLHSYGAVFFKSSLAKEEDSVQNEAFEGIGDDDL